MQIKSLQHISTKSVAWATMLFLGVLSSAAAAPASSSLAQRDYNDLTLMPVEPTLFNNGQTTYRINPVTHIGPDVLQVNENANGKTPIVPVRTIC